MRNRVFWLNKGHITHKWDMVVKMHTGETQRNGVKMKIKMPMVISPRPTIILFLFVNFWIFSLQIYSYKYVLWIINILTSYICSMCRACVLPLPVHLTFWATSQVTEAFFKCLQLLTVYPLEPAWPRTNSLISLCLKFLTRKWMNNKTYYKSLCRFNY